MKKNLLIGALLVLGFSGTAYALPYFTSTQTLVPFSNNAWDIGTSTATYRNAYITQICLSGDCKSAWPTVSAASAQDPFPNHATTTALVFNNASTTFSFLGSGLVGANQGSLYGFASSSLFGFIPASNAITLTTNYPITGGGDLTTNRSFSLAFGTTTSNTWAGTQTFTNPLIDGTLSGLIAGNSGTTYAVSTTSMNASITGSSGSVANSVTFNSSGGAAAGQTYNGSSAVTIDYHTVGAQIAGSYESPLTFNTPMMRSANTISWVGLATTSQPASSNLLVSNGGGGVFGVGTTSATCGTGVSCTSFNVLGGSNPSFALATMNAGVLGSVVNSVAPTSQATSTLYGAGTKGGVLGWDGASIFWTATSTDISAFTTGTLSVGRGGTGVGTFTASQLLYGNGTVALSSVGTSSLAVGTSITSSGTLGAQVGGTASTLSLNMANANTWTALQNFSNATSTQMSIDPNGRLYIPANTNPTINATGDIAIDTTSASSSVRYWDGTAKRSLFPDGSGGLPFASSTLAYLGAYGTTGTTTITQMRFYRPASLLSFYCDTDVGTAYVLIGNGTASTTGKCTVGGTYTTSSVTWVMGQAMVIQIGDQATNPNLITVSPNVRKDAD